VDDNALHELTAAYALDALDAVESREYEQHLAHCGRCQVELAELSATASALAFGAAPADPPAALRERILDAARAERSNVVPLRRAYRFYGRIPARAIAVAASVVAVGLGIWNIALHRQLASSHQALRSVLLHGAAGSVVLGSSGQGTMVVANLVSPPAGKTYEAWVIVDGRARPAGIFAAGGKTVVVHLRLPVPTGAIVAVTIEREGGSQQPTGHPFITSAQV
jgi:anti-sigma-K factor RskA